MPTSRRDPVLFLDVDGVLIPFGADQDYRTFGDGFENPLLSRVDPGLGVALQRLRCELVWATTWSAEANAVVAPILGLSDLPVVEMQSGEQDSLPRGVHWKTPLILDWADGRPFAWVDDEMSAADEFFVELSAQSATLLRRIDHRVGLRTADLLAVENWLAAL